MAYTTIDDPSAYFTTTLWTGSGTSSGRSITNSANAGNFQPDWLWIKPRTGTNATHHQLYDSSRGVSKSLRSSATAAEIASSAYGHVSAFDTNGFTSVAGSNNNENINENSSTFVAWQWKANGGTTTTNDASSTSIGNTDSVIQANTEAGFSIVTFSGTGSGMTVAHGLGGTPDLIISKARNDTENWAVHTTIIDGSVDFLRLSETDAKGNSSFSAPTSTVFGYNGSNNYVVYCFRSIKGYSKIGTYTGNGNADGTFIYLGFKPAWLLVKQTDGADNWQLVDNKRDPINLVDAFLMPDTTSAETTHNNNIQVDFLSNGFKCRNTNSVFNGSGNSYIYMAFAENPFVSSKGAPTTAR